MLRMLRCALSATAFAILLAAGSHAQTDNVNQKRREPSSPARPFVVLSSQKLTELERSLRGDNKAEDLLSAGGSQLRVAVQHERDKPVSEAEVHDESDDVYYVLEGSATLTLGGTLDSPLEVQPGEWRASRITGGRTIEISKGDLVVVPRGTPHQRGTVGRDFSMILIKVFAEAQPPARPEPADKDRKP